MNQLKKISDFFKQSVKIKNIDHDLKIMIGEIILLFGLLSIFFIIGLSRGNPKNVAKNYFELYTSGSWAEVYRQTDFPESDFLTEESFSAYMSTVEIEKITNFVFKETDMESSGEIGSDPQTLTIRLIRQKEKTMLFFPTWKISSKGLVAENYNILVPKNSNVLLDHYPLRRTELLKKAKNAHGMDHYQVTIFRGNHHIQAAPPWKDTLEADFSTYDRSAYILEEISFSDEAKNIFEGTIKAAVKKMVQASFDKKQFYDIASLFSEDYRTINQKTYEKLTAGMNRGKEYRLNEVSFQNFKCDILNEKYDGEHNIIEVRLQYDYTSGYTYAKGTYWDLPPEIQHKSTNQSGAATAGFLFDGTEYKLAWIKLNLMF